MCRRGYVAGTLSRSSASPRRAGEVDELSGGRHALLRGVDDLLDALLRRLALLLEVAADGLDLALHAGAVALRNANRTGAALAELTLHARTRPLDAALGAVAGGRAAALETAQVALEALLRGLGRAVRLRQLRDGLGDAIGGGQGRTHGDQDDALCGLLDLLDRGARGRLAVCGGALGGGTTALGGGATALGGGAPLVLGGGRHVLPHSSRRFRGRGGFDLAARRGPYQSHRTRVCRNPASESLLQPTPEIRQETRQKGHDFVTRGTRVRSNQVAGSSSSGSVGRASGPVQTRFSASMPAAATTSSENRLPSRYWRSLRSSPSSRASQRDAAERVDRRRSSPVRSCGREGSTSTPTASITCSA